MNNENATRPLRLSIFPQMTYEDYVSEYYRFFLQHLLEEETVLCTCFDERQGILDTFVIRISNPLFDDPKFIEQVNQLENLSCKVWGTDLLDWGLIEKEEDDYFFIPNDTPSYLPLDFIDHVLKQKSPIRLSKHDYYMVMSENHGCVKTIPSWRIEEE